MPTPVSAARQCLTEEAARVFDDAVKVARRRSHGQTTSLHVVSALLSSPSSSMLRDGCTRARSSGYSPRLQFRALELCVGVSLDRMASSKTAEDPPVSNSLMAAIKRSQANQKRHPETFHLYQQLQQQNSFSCVKVDLKHFVLSILDDPIVNRVFDDGGFRSSDIKAAIAHPPPVSRFTRSRYPFSGFPLPGIEDNCRRIGEILVNQKGKKKNPLLIGVCAEDALNSFKDCLERRTPGILPAEVDGLRVFCIEKEISEFVVGGGSEEMMGLKFKELNEMVEGCSGPGIVVNLGEFKGFFVEDGSMDSMSYVVSQLSGLVEVHGGRLWLIGASDSYETYMKFISLFPSVDKLWDLHLLPITSKPSLMGSFVPLGGFFSAPPPPEFKGLGGGQNQSITRCNLCNKKYEQEVSVLMKGQSINSVSDASLSSWLQMVQCNTTRGLVQANDDKAVLSAELEGLHRKWNDICQHLHHTRPVQPDILNMRSGFAGEGTSSSLKENVGAITNRHIEALKNRQLEMEVHRSPYHAHRLSLPRDDTSLSSGTSVTTDLRLGTTLHKSAADQRLSGSVSPKLDPKDFKSLQKVLSEKVGWQSEAICTISQTVSRCRAGNGTRSNSRGDIWLSFSGPDKVGKRKIAAALAETIFGSKNCLISVDLSSEDGIPRSNSIFDHQDSRRYDVINARGNTIVDYIAGELRKKPHSVVLLENIDTADFLAQNSLSRAIKTGKFVDTNGREISINSMIFVLTTTTVTKSNKNPFSSTKLIKFSEERILEAKSWQMQIEIDDRNALTPNKRKLHDTTAAKRVSKESRFCLDLNIPVEELEEETENDEHSRAWLEEFFDQVDEQVEFESFDFDALAEEVFTLIRTQFQKVVGPEPLLLEIDAEAMVQVLAACWLSEKKRALEDWVEHVLCKSLSEANKQKQESTSSSSHVVKIVACEGFSTEEYAPGICLPATVITVN